MYEKIKKDIAQEYYVNKYPILYNKHTDGGIPASNGLSERISKDLKKRGFKYMGGIIVYSHLQAWVYPPQTHSLKHYRLEFVHLAREHAPLSKSVERGVGTQLSHP